MRTDRFWNRFSVCALWHLGHIYVKRVAVMCPLFYLVNSGVTRASRLGHCNGNVLRGRTLSFPSWWPQEGGARCQWPPAALLPFSFRDAWILILCTYLPTSKLNNLGKAFLGKLPRCSQQGGGVTCSSPCKALLDIPEEKPQCAVLSHMHCFDARPLPPLPHGTHSDVCILSLESSHAPPKCE